MSLAPVPFHGKEKEPPFDVAAVRKIITDLIVHCADEVESEELEIKSWCRNERDLAEHVSEACSCLANAAGGFVLVGVEDGPNVGRKFSKCPHPCVTRTWLNTSIHNLTQPPVECAVHDISALAGGGLGAGGHHLFLMGVPRTRHINRHPRTGGAERRGGKKNHPQ